MDESVWLIVLMSQVAAESEWVNREVEYWLDGNDPDRIIPVLTDGEYSWNDGHITSDAAPVALRDAFADQPRWVDLRFARTDEQLDLKNASFRAAIADIAAPMRGVPKEELESEEVRQHRRTVRTAWAAGIGMLLLVVIASTAAVLAVGQANRATEKADQANEASLALLDSAITYVSPLDLAIQNDLSPIPLPIMESPPNTARLDFLNQFCGGGEGCANVAVFVHPELPLQTGRWVAYEPFHIRHGFSEVDGTLGIDYDVRVHVSRVDGPPLADQEFLINQVYEFASDAVVQVTTGRCGPTHLTETEPQSCTQFLHDFPQGLPPGRYAIWVEWHAPCAAWTVADICERPTQVINLFNSSTIIPLYHDDYTTIGSFNVEPQWPFDPWDQGLPERCAAVRC